MIIHESDMTPAKYSLQLEEKVLRVKSQFLPIYNGEMSVFESEPKHYRMRAEFRVWHEGDDLYHIMFDPETKEKRRVDQFPVANKEINSAMRLVLESVKQNEILRRKLFQIDYLSGLSGEVLVSLLYHKPLDDEWESAVRNLRSELNSELKIDFVGRSRKQKRIIDRDFITESLPVNNVNYLFKHVENSFTQPNARVNCQMIEWTLHATRGIEGDLLEFYCGAGNFSLPLAQNFRRVVGTEISRTSVDAANTNIEMNGIENVSIVRMASEEFTDAYVNKKKGNRLEAANISELQISTVLVDPPRAGLDDDTLKLIADYPNIIYISCNPNTLFSNLETLTKTHDTVNFAMFDQFPYTHHAECGVILKKR